LHAASSGRPLAVIELVSAVAGARDPFAIDWAAQSATSVVEHRTKQVRALGAGPRRALAIVNVLGGRARVDKVLAVSRACIAHAKAKAEGSKTDADHPDVALGDVAELERAGLVRRSFARDGIHLAIDRPTREAIDL